MSRYPFLGLGFNSWTQKFGNKIFKIVVSAPYDDEGADASGSVYVYDIDGTNEIKILPHEPEDLDNCGITVSVGSDRIVVGCPYDNDPSNSGAVYVYNLNGTRKTVIKASDASSADNFGYSVAVGNNKIVVGSRLDDDPSNSGSVYVYDLDGTNEVKITASDGAAGDQFGFSVAVGSNKIVVGAYGDDDNGSNSGSAYIYNLDGTGEVKITASDGAADDLFGFSVAVGNNKIVVSAGADDDDGSLSGSAYIYNLDGTGETKITASDGAAGDEFGYDVAVGSNKIVVGARQDDDNGSSSGSVYVYDLDGTNEVKITASDGAAGDGFGESVAIANNKIVVSARFNDDAGSTSGSAYIYDLDGTNEIKITASDAAAGDGFGYSVAIG